MICSPYVFHYLVDRQSLSHGYRTQQSCHHYITYTILYHGYVPLVSLFQNYITTHGSWSSLRHFYHGYGYVGPHVPHLWNLSMYHRPSGAAAALTAPGSAAPRRTAPCLHSTGRAWIQIDVCVEGMWFRCDFYIWFLILNDFYIISIDIYIYNFMGMVVR